VQLVQRVFQSAFDAQQYAGFVRELTNGNITPPKTGYMAVPDAYTDHVGGDQYNLRLSVRRANAVQQFYTTNGVAGNRIESRGLGKAPIPCAQDDTNGKGCRANRRAESFPVSPFPFAPRR
jgi:hypothetical protein